MVESVLIRPQMYTVGGSVLEVAAFLEGYYSGMAKIAPYSHKVAEWTDFVAAIAVDGHSGWASVFRHVDSTFNTADEAFDWLLSAYLDHVHASP
jgi:hypothetical protein